MLIILLQVFSVTTQRILSWKNTTTLWLHGYWSYDWADNYVKVDSIDAKANVFTVSEKTPPLDGVCFEHDVLSYPIINCFDYLFNTNRVCCKCSVLCSKYP